MGNVYMDLPEYDIKALGRNHMNYTLEGQFNILNCKGKGDYDLAGKPLFKTPYEDVYSQMYPPLYVKKYGVTIAYISLISNEKMLIKENFDKVIGSKYYWMYIDRDLEYKDVCKRESFKDPNLEFEMTANVAFKKGWNFMRRNLVEVQNYGEREGQITPKKIHFTASNPNSMDVKWYLVQTKSNEKIQAAKKEYELKHK